MATAAKSTPAQAGRAAQTGYPAGGLRFDWTYALLSALLIAGVWIDGWAHFHGRTDNTFFTPWHFLFYSAFGVVALFTAYQQLRNTSRGYAFRRALPQGYWLSLVGGRIVAFGGVGDMIWHTLFGIEAGTEALTSPTHLMLGIGMALIASGPLRAAWRRTDARGWVQLGQVVLCSVLVFSLVSFFTSYAHPINLPLAVEGVNGRSSRSGIVNFQDFGVTMILLQAAVLAGVTLILTRRFRIPFGGFTFIFGLNALLMAILTDTFMFVPGALVTGLIADALFARFHPGREHPAAFHVFAFAVPAIYYALYFITIAAVERIGWHIHVWAGAIFLSGMVGLLLSFLMTGSEQSAEA